jgi:ABC-type glycerol-3-phosphate transport system substrate-binding protein
MKMKNSWKLLLSALLLAVLLAACNGNRNEGGDEPVQNGDESVRGLGGLEINIANWWTDECTQTADPESFSQRVRWDHRAEVEEEYNFTMRYVRYGGWHDVRDDVSQQLLAGNREFQMWIVEPTWFATHHAQGMFAPIPMENFDEESGIEWSRGLIELTMREGNPHGFASGAEMAAGVYFNMRLLEEAGLPRDLPYTLQAENNWTWDTFLEMVRTLALAGDDGTGVRTSWALTTFHKDMLSYALASNGAAFARVDPETGRFVNTTNEDAFRETIQFMVQLRDEMLAMHEDDIGGPWNAFIQMFNDGLGAIRCAANYVAGNLELADDWGFVAFPRGPRSDRHYAWVSQNLYTIPHFYNEDEVADFMFAYRMWNMALEDDDPDDWRFDAYAVHRDPRSVEETMANFTRNASLQLVPAHDMMPGLSDRLDHLFAFRVWVGYDASQIIEEGQLVWEEFLERVNNLGN